MAPFALCEAGAMPRHSEARGRVVSTQTFAMQEKAKDLVTPDTSIIWAQLHLYKNLVTCDRFYVDHGKNCKFKKQHPPFWGGMSNGGDLTQPIFDRRGS